MKKYLITGLLIWIPLVITIWVLKLIVDALDQTLLLLPKEFQTENWLGLHVPGMGVVMTLVIVFLTGLLTTNLIGARLVAFWHDVLHRIPVVRSIYSSVKQISDTLFSSSGQAFRKALLVQWPQPGTWTIAFLTGIPGGDVASHLSGDYLSVYVPTTPNPTGGYFVIVARKDVIELDMSVDAALKYIISMGVVPPNGKGQNGVNGNEQAQPRMSMRSHYCGELNAALIGKQVSIAGWAHRRRDHGGVIFIDLRDREGLAQVVCDPDRADAFKLAEGVRNEFVLRITGVVRARPAGTVNPNLRSGEVEVLAHAVEILNPSLTPPFQLDDDNLSETVRLEHRILDLRRDVMQKNLRLRHATAKAARAFLDGHGFIDIETPVLYKSTPEGAREFLVPSRINDGQFYALPQSPQLFKQMLMIAGFDRYYQIVKCFRDEDLRADRQPEFTQIDIETSFLGEEAIRKMMEALARHLFKEVLGVALPDPFPVMKYEDAMRDYGVDKPDMRIALKLAELTDVMKDVDFKVFSGPANGAGGRVAALCVPGGATISRKEIDDYTEYLRGLGAKGLAWVKVNELGKGAEGLQSPIVKFFPLAVIEEILSRTKAKAGDIIFFGADRAEACNAHLGALRQKVGHDRGLAEKGWRPLWVVDFPMFEYDEESKEWKARHHPFTSPKDGHEAFIETDQAKAYAKAYDMVLNGWEVAGGSVRIHRQEVQQQVFRALKISPEDQQAKFGFLLQALQYGAPPHGGIAFGFDRLVTLMAGAEAIRDVIAFPKTQRGQDLVTGAPSSVTERQLRELHIRLRNTTPQ